MKTVIAAALALLVSIVSPQAPAVAADYTAASSQGACANSYVLGFIKGNFGIRAANVLRSDIAITDIHDMRQRQLVLRDDTRHVEREYCGATAVTTDGQTRALWYLIERNTGFAGLGSNIEFCLSGLDPWSVYGANCASLR